MSFPKLVFLEVTSVGGTGAVLSGSQRLILGFTYRKGKTDYGEGKKATESRK